MGGNPDSAGLTDIIENYAQKVGNRQVWPRYHQMDVVRKLLVDAREKGAGQRYLIQHSAGSGKSNSIAWLARQLIGVERDGRPAFDSVIVITDRVVLDSQTDRTFRQFTQVPSTVAHADTSGDLRRFITEGKKIIIATVQKLPFILDDIGNAHRDGNFSIIIDEAHSGQGRKTAGALSWALGDSGSAEDDEGYLRGQGAPDNRRPAAAVQRQLLRLHRHAEEHDPGAVRSARGAVKHLRFHGYTMKQAIEEGFIMDVLSDYTPVNRHFSLVRSIEDATQFDSKRAQRKLRRYMENHDYTIAQKAEIIVDHFHDSVLPAKPPSTRGQISPFPRPAAISPNSPALEHFAGTVAVPSRVEHRNQAAESSCDTCYWRRYISHAIMKVPLTFTGEELDLIINFDIKHRMGREGRTWS